MTDPRIQRIADAIQSNTDDWWHSRIDFETFDRRAKAAWATARMCDCKDEVLAVLRDRHNR